MKTRKLLSYLLTITTLISTIIPSFAYKDSISSEVYHDVEINSEANNTTVYAEVGSAFKVVIPKHIILDGATKSGAYTVDVSGDIAGNEVVMVVPDEYFKLSSVNKLDIYAYIDQDKVSWTYQDMNVIGNGLIETENMTAGSWNGNFNFNIKLESSGELNTNATNSNGEEVKVTVNNIAGVQKEQLLGALVQSGQVSSDEDVDTLLNIDNIENVDNVEIDTSDVANPGDTVVIVQEKENEWDYVSTETVNSNNKVYLNAANKTPVSFVQTQPDGTIHVHTYEEQVAVPATCETDGTLLMNCECDKSYSFAIPASHELEVVEKKDENGELINKYYECNNCTYSILNLTKLYTGEEISHKCEELLIEKYDKNKHWNECSACGKVFNENIHSFKTTGTYSCNISISPQYNICDCGYSYQLAKKQHTKSSNTATAYGDSLTHYYKCSSCGIQFIPSGTPSACTNSNGQSLGCLGATGKCIYCNRTVSSNRHSYFSSIINEIKKDGNIIEQIGTINCTSCKNVGATFKTTLQRTGTNYYKTTLTYTILDNSITLARNPFMSHNYGSNISTSAISASHNGNTHTYTTNISYSSNLGVNKISVNFHGAAKQYGTEMAFHVNTVLDTDYTAPILKNASIVTQDVQNEYNKKIVVNAKYTDDLDSICYIRILNEDMTTVISDYKSIGKVNGIFDINIDLIDENNETKTIYLQAKDTTGNLSALYPIQIPKMDSKAPTPSLNTTTSTEWSKTKEMLFSAIDEGAGNVQIAFNNINEYVDMTKNDTLYTKTYQFSGDVYGEVTAAIYYKDAVGNVATQFIKVHNLDNTAPTILNVDRNENILTVLANDLNKELGLEGSGIDSYAITWTSAPPQESDWQESNTFEITKGGTYYLWVKDNVGNVSEPYKIKVLL